MSIINYAAIDPWGLSSLEPGQSGYTDSFNRIPVMNRFGDVCSESPIKAQQLDLSMPYTYCGANLSAETDVQTFWTTMQPTFSDLSGTVTVAADATKAATSIDITGLTDPVAVINEGTLLGFAGMEGHPFVVLEEVTAAGGAATLNIFPALHADVLTGVTALLTAKIVTGHTLSMGVDAPLTFTVDGHAHIFREAIVPGTLGGHSAAPAYDMTTYYPSNIMPTGIPDAVDIPGFESMGCGALTLEYTYEVEHEDSQGSKGLQLDGNTKGAKLTVAATGLGEFPILDNSGGVTYILDPKSWGLGTEGNTWSLTAHTYPLRTPAP